MTSSNKQDGDKPADPSVGLTREVSEQAVGLGEARLAEGIEAPHTASQLERVGQQPGAGRLVWGRFIGCTEELAALRAANDAALSGQASLVMVTIRRASSFARQARRSGSNLKHTDTFWRWALHLSEDEAFAALIPDLERMERSGVENELAAMHRLKGQLVKRKSNWKEAENSFRTSVEIARRQSAKSLELSASTSLGRMLAKQDRRDEARAMLADIYNWFTEGFDTADLKDAKAVLNELSA